jgi:CRP-like cAMP-binding protein
MGFETLLLDDEISRTTSTLSFKKGEIILTQGEVSKGLYYITRGECVLQTTLPGHKKPSVSDKKTSGDFFAGVSFINQSPMMNTVIAHTRVTTIIIPYEVLIGLSHINPLKAIDLISPILQESSTQLDNLIKNIKSSDVMLPTFKNLSHLKKVPLKQIRKIDNEPILVFDNLKQLPFFKMVYHECLGGLIKKFKFYRAKKNDLILKEGEKIDGILYVISGALQTFITIRKRSYKLNVIGPGMGLGIVSFFNDTALNTSTFAREDVVLLKINEDDFKNIAAFSPIAEEKILFLLRSKLVKHVTNVYLHYLQALAIRELT